MGTRIGFIINPIAGMGGRVGLKGTDGEAYRIALEKGAKPVSPDRARVFLENLNLDNIGFIVAPSIMGYDVVVKTKHSRNIIEVVGRLESRVTTAEDTRRIAREMLSRNIDLLVFVGGDGTARDIMDAVDSKIPVLGVPSGVKVYSGVFAVNPVAAAKIVEAFVQGRASIVEEEVLDIDEEAFRRDELRIKLCGYMKTITAGDLLQPGKQPSISTCEEEDNKKAIARTVAEEMEPDTLYILGPGTTIKAIADELGVEKTVLGVDAVYNKRLVGKDLDEKTLLRLLERYPRAKIIVTPIGGQGFIFGRGNQQISPEVIKRAGGKENIIVVATRRKIQNLRVLRADTGDPEVDAMLKGYIRVVVDYNTTLVMKVA